MSSPDLSASEYRVLVEQAPVLIWRADADGACDYFNERWLAFTGRTLEQELGDGWAEGVHPDDLSDCLATYRGAFARREPFEMRYRLRRSDGEYRWLHDRGASLAGRGGEFAGYVGSCIDITELIDAQEACRRSEARFDLFMHHMPAAAFLKDDEGRYVYVNRGFEEAFRTTSDDVLGKTSEELYPAGLAERFSDEDRAARSGTRVVTVRERRVLDGAERVWDVRKFGVPEDKAKAAAFVGGLAVDVTAVVAAERELRRSQARLETLLRLGELGDRSIQEVMDFGLEEAVRLTESLVGYVYFYDEATEQFTLYSWSTAVMAECSVLEKQTVYDLHKTGLWGEAVRQRRPIVVNDFSAEHPWKKGYPEGHVHLARYLTVPVFQAGRIVAVAGVGNKEAPYGEDDVRQLQLYMDRLWGIVERLRAEAALRRSEERYRAVVEDQTEIISRFRADGTLTFVNEVFCRVFHKTLDEVLGRRWHPAALPEDVPMVEAKLAELSPSNPVVTIENRVVTPTRGVRWMQFVNRAFYDAGGRLLEIQAVGRDVTERREAQERERAYERQLQRLASELSLAEERERRTLAAELHDTVAQGLAVARMRLGAVRAACPAKECAAGLDEVQGLVGQALRDTRALLLELSSPVLYHLGLAAALETLGEETCRKAGLGWDFAADGRPKELGLDAQVLLFQSVRELLSNVVRHADARSVDVRVWEEGGRVCVQVADDGVGMPASAGEEVPRGDSGFGLFSIRERLRLAGGQLRIEGASGGGSRVLLSVPVSAVEGP